MRTAAAALVLLVTGCGGGSAPAATVDVPVATPRPVETLGRDLFAERVIGTNPGCVTCHSLEEGVTLVGPSLSGVSSRIEGMSDSDYLRQSIVDPDAYVVPGFAAGQMSQNWGEVLTEEQVESLVDFLVTSG